MSIERLGHTTSEILRATPFVALTPKERWAKLNLMILTGAGGTGRNEVDGFLARKKTIRDVNLLVVEQQMQPDGRSRNGPLGPVLSSSFRNVSLFESYYDS